MDTIKFWEYHPSLFSDLSLDEVVTECSTLWSGERMYDGKKTNISRKSCVFTTDIKLARQYLPSYNDMKFYTWEESPITMKLKERLEQFLNNHSHEESLDDEKELTSFDYVLLHCYEDGTASIGYHNDKESLDADIASVSIGQRRKFRIRNMGEFKGYIEEYSLGEGDLFVMKKGMQHRYVHGIPPELKIKSPRCNWTFRKFPKY